MENKTGNLMSGLGGAAILALFLSPTGISPSKAAQDVTDSKPMQARMAENVRPPASDSVSGPWSAICDEYATDFDRGKDHLKIPTGAVTHKNLEKAEDEAVEYTKHTQTERGVIIDQKFQVKTHPVGNPSTCVRGQRDLTVIIATIPDPLASHFALYFDRDIEALEKAAALSGFSISRYWLPWDPTVNPSAIGTDATRLAEWRLWTQEPGILVFHNGEAKRLMIFLVGETPTSGIQRIQFGHALWYAQELTGSLSSVERPYSEKDPVPVTLKIAGPHFSGSLLGIREVISQKEVVSPRSILHILSPYASSGTLIENFTNGLFDSPKGAASTHSTGWFISLKSRAKDQENESICYLNGLGYEENDIAFVSEDESAFSVASQKSIDVSIDKTEHHQSDNDSKIQCAKPWGRDSVLDRNHFLRLKYPRDLSSLRNKTDISTPADTEINGVKLPFWNVPVTLGERVHVVQDSPPVFAADQEASRIDHALQVIVARLRQHKARAVVIDASNSLDTLFLLEYFSRNLPNLRFATDDADEFEIGRLQNAELTGTLSINDLPLLRDSLQKKTNDRISFPSGDAEATYVATSLLIENVDLNSTKLRDATDCATNSVVGRSGFILMTPGTTNLTFPCISSNDAISPFLLQPEPEGSNEAQSEISRSWSILMLIIVTASYVHLASLFRSGVLLKRDSPKNRPLRCSYPADCGVHEAERISMLIALNNQYLLLNFVVATTTISLWNIHQRQGFANILRNWRGLAMVPFQWQSLAAAIHQRKELAGILDQWQGLAGILAVTVLASLVLCTIGSALLVYRCISWSRFCEYRRPLALSTSYLFATLVMWSLVLWGYHDANRFNISYNALRIALYPEGVSPLTPFIVISVAYIVYATVELSGINWAARRHVWLGFKSVSDSTLHRLHRRLQLRLNPFPQLELRTIVFALVGTIIFGTAFNLRDSLSGFDGPYFKYWFLFFGFGASLLIITITVFRAWSIWGKLKDTLHWLQETGLRPAFGSLHRSDLPKLRIWDLGKREQDLTIHTKTVDVLVEVSGDETAQCAREALDKIRKAQANGLQHSCEEANSLSHQLNEPMDRALTYLTKNPDDCGVFGKSCQHYLALRFVALIRYSLLHIRNLYTFVVYGFASLAICVASYPFEGKSNLSALLAMLFIFILLSIALMFAQIQKDSILSVIEGSDAGRVSYLELTKHLISIGGVPALIVLATQFPALGQVVLSWAKPALDLVR